MTSNPKLIKHSRKADSTSQTDVNQNGQGKSILEPSGSLGNKEQPDLHPIANRNYKDTVFRMLFSEKSKLLSLYNAVNGTAYTDPGDLTIVTLDSAIYMEMKNDLAFLLNTGLYLYEHQSTENPNMPLRDLFYIAKEYQKLVDNQSLYASTPVRLHTPRFIVFYNGTEETADRRELRLSDLYMDAEEDPALELRVLELNINHGHNAELLDACQTLKDYARYVDRVRMHSKDMDIREAVERAVDECIREGILEEFLRKNRAEVIGMSIFEYDKEREEKKMKEAYRRAYREEGYEAGREEGRNEERANTERERANTERERANTERERARAEKAEREVERLKKLLAER